MTEPLSTPPRPEPVLDAANVASSVSALVVAVGAAFVLVGWATQAQVQAWAVVAGGIVTAVGGMLAYLLPRVTAKGARAQVTPLADPRGIDGSPLAIGGSGARPAPAPAAPPTVPQPVVSLRPVEQLPNRDAERIPDPAPQPTPVPQPVPAVVQPAAAPVAEPVAPVALGATAAPVTDPQ